MSKGFTKYREWGAYHWRELYAHPLHGWPYTRSRIEWVVRQCVGSRTVLEIGCGDGALLGRLAKAGKAVVGVDADETGLRLAREMFERHGLKGDFYADLARVEGSKFDAVILAEVIEHLENPDGVLAGAARRLSAGGRLVLTTPIRLLERSPDAHHVHEFWPGEVVAVVGKHFADVQLTRMHPVWLVDLMCFGVGRIRPAAVLANFVRLATGIEFLDRATSPTSLYWTQGVVATGPRVSA
ncbi:MAG: class I SAM-dependent methyltransferase [Anaerolineae bacterium]